MTKARAKTNAIRMPGKERPAASRLVIQKPPTRSLTIGISAETRNPPLANPSGKPQRVSITDSFGASPVSSALDHSARRDPGGATPTITRILTAPNLLRHPQRNLLVRESTAWRGGLLLLRHKPACERRFVVYFCSAAYNPRVQTYVTRNAKPGQSIRFTISGEGQMPNTAPAGAMGQPSASEAPSSAAPGGGIGAPINTPDPLSRYKWWILSALALILATAAAFFLRKRSADASLAAADSIDTPAAPIHAPSQRVAVLPSAPPARTAAASPLLNTIKDELFAIESDKLTGKISAAEYAEIKAGLETLLKRELQRRQ